MRLMEFTDCASAYKRTHGRVKSPRERKEEARSVAIETSFPLARSLSTERLITHICRSRRAIRCDGAIKRGAKCLRTHLDRRIPARLRCRLSLSRYNTALPIMSIVVLRERRYTKVLFLRRCFSRTRDCVTHYHSFTLAFSYSTFR